MVPLRRASALSTKPVAWTAEEQRRIALTGLRTRLADRLPGVLEESVRELIAGWQSDPNTQQAGIAHPVPFLVVRTQPISGPAGRELQVLALLLDGVKLEEIGRTLHIASSPVQDHIKNMVEKRKAGIGPN